MMLEMDQDNNNGSWAFLIWAIPLVLSLCGTMMIASLSLRNYSGSGSPYAMPLKQFTYLAIGIVVMFLVSGTAIQTLRRISGGLWFTALIALFLTLAPGIGVSVGGARRWINIGITRFQPLEYLMFALPLFLADKLNSAEVTHRDDLHAFVRPTFLLMAISGIPMFSQHLGGLMLVGAVCLLMHAENRGWKYPLRSMLIVLGVIVLLILITPYRMRRIQSFRDPWADPQNKGYQIIQGLIAFANGGLHGMGIGKGLQEAHYLPASQTDYIFAAFGEEFGLVGTLFLLSLYAGWTYRIYKMHKNLNDSFLSCLTLGMTASIICPMFINLAGVMHVLPLTGIPMPFLSMGGSAMLFMWAKVGVLVAISQYGLRPVSSLALPSRASRPRIALPEPLTEKHDPPTRPYRRQSHGSSESIITLPKPDLTPRRQYNRDNRPNSRPGSRSGRGRRNG